MMNSNVGGGNVNIPAAVQAPALSAVAGLGNENNILLIICWIYRLLLHYHSIYIYIYICRIYNNR